MRGRINTLSGGRRYRRKPILTARWEKVHRNTLKSNNVFNVGGVPFATRCCLRKHIQTTTMKQINGVAFCVALVIED
jgi:hypothetical protein